MRGVDKSASKHVFKSLKDPEYFIQALVNDLKTMNTTDFTNDFNTIIICSPINAAYLFHKFSHKKYGLVGIYMWWIAAWRTWQNLLVHQP